MNQTVVRSFHIAVVFVQYSRPGFMQFCLMNVTCVREVFCFVAEFRVIMVKGKWGHTQLRERRRVAHIPV